MEQSNVVVFPAPEDKSANNKRYIQCLQAVTSYWNGHLLASDLTVLCFVMDRTLRYGKVREVITYNQIQNGVQVKATGKMINSGVTVSRRTVFRAIDRLEIAGFLSITRTKSTFRGFEANVIEINFKLLLSGDISLVRKPKNRVKSSDLPLCHNDTTLVPNSTNPLCQIDTTNIQIDKLQKINYRTTPTAGAVGAIVDEVVGEVVERVTTRSRVTRSARASRLSIQVTHGAVIAAWKETMLKYYPRVPVVHFTIPEFKKFRTTARYNLVDVDLVEFFDWAIAQWEILRGGRLQWMNNKKEQLPATPRLDILSRYLKTFARAYAEDVTLADGIHDPEAEGQRNLKKKLKDMELKLAQETMANVRLKRDNKRLLRSRPTSRTRPKVPISSATMEEAKANYEQDTVEEAKWLNK